jgi:hypothetical protein
MILRNVELTLDCSALQPKDPLPSTVHFLSCLNQEVLQML